MKHKATSEFTKEEKEWMDTLAVNYIIAQAESETREREVIK